MKNELAIVVSAVISSTLTLCGVFVNWLLSNISNTEKLRLEEKSTRSRALEEKYHKVLYGIELFLRSENSTKETDQVLSELNAAASLFLDEDLRREFNTFAKMFEEYRKLYTGKGNSYKYIASAKAEYPTEWNNLIRQKDVLAQAMREHINSLINFKN